MYPILIDDLIRVSESVHISINDFENKFGEKDDHKFKYKYLNEHTHATQAWKLVFKQWKSEGILT